MARHHPFPVLAVPHQAQIRISISRRYYHRKHLGGPVMIMIEVDLVTADQNPRAQGPGNIIAALPGDEVRPIDHDDLGRQPGCQLSGVPRRRYQVVLPMHQEYWESPWISRGGVNYHKSS